MRCPCCWAHVRRYLVEAFDNGYLKVEPLLKLVRNLYQIEHDAKARAEKKGTVAALFRERKTARRMSQKMVADFFVQAKALRDTERPSSPVAKAVNYALNIEAELKKFLDNPKLNIDNNPAERLNRGVAIIRKNCLFAGSETGGQRLVILYSFAATCKANNIGFCKWLEDVLPRLMTTPAEQIDSLLPPN
ncbi:MAG: transposase [Victivallales bacterium]